MAKEATPNGIDPAPKKPYRKPELKNLGTLDAITRGGAGSIPDILRGAHRKGRGRRG